MNDFLSKPITPESLMQILRQWLPTHFAPPERPSYSSEGSSEAILIVPQDEIMEEVSQIKERMEELRSIFDEPMLRQSRSMARKDWEERIGDATAALAQSDWSTLGKTIHRLAGSALELGAKHLTKRCRVMEAACQAKDGAEAKRRLPELIAFYRGLLVALEAVGISMTEESR
jgi:hypothetical protein